MFWSLQSVSWDDALGLRAGQSRIDGIVRWIGSEVESTGRILDLGCGTGEISLALADRGHAVTAIDFSEGMLRRARKKLRHRPSTVEFGWADLNDPLPFPPGSFDTAVCISALQCSNSPRSFLAETRRVLAEGGSLLLRVKSDPEREIVRGDAAPAGRFFSPLKRWASGRRFVRSFSMDELLDMLGDSGFRSVHHESEGPWLVVVARAAGSRR